MATTASDASDGEAEWSARDAAEEVVDDDCVSEEEEEESGADDDFESDGEVLSTRLRSSRRVSAGGTSRRIDSYFRRVGDDVDSGDDDGDDASRPTKKRAKLSTGGGGSKRKQRTRADDAGDGDERSRHKRRNIADVRGDEELDESTRKARDAERARASHIIDFEQLGEVELVSADDDAPVKEPLLCLNVRMDGSTPTGVEGSEDAPVFVHESISGKLKKHQVVGTRFLWSHVGVEPDGFGCVLADFMGLGKTLQVITVVQAFLARKRMNRDDVLVPRHKHVLILAPTICVRNWEAEVVKWLGKKEARRLGLTTLESSREKKMTDRVHVVKQWHRRGGLLIMGYELYRILVLQASGEEKIAAGNAKHTAQIKDMYKCLADPGPDLIVLDEGHRVRDRKSKLVKALTHVKTTRRIILTGYPLQNHLEEYWTMVNFARPDYLGTLEEFKNRFVDPIKNGQCIDSSDADLRLARQRAYVLTRELKPLVLRRDQQYLFKQLPPKKEWVLICKLTEPQMKLYRTFLKDGVPTRGKGDKVDVLGGYHISMAIANHPDVLCESYQTLEEEMRKNPSKFAGKNVRFNMLGEDIDGGDFSLYDAPAARKSGASSRLSPQGTSETEGEESDGDLLDQLAAGPTKTSSRVKATAPGLQHRLSFASDFLQSYEKSLLETSGKMMILMEILAECREIGDRVILFSQSIPTLNTIEKMIALSNRKARRHTHRLNYLRIDGSTPAQERFRMISQFNDLEEDVDLILISTKAGGEGINLCAGNRIVIFDVCWNPSNDSQSMCRSYRFGQTKNVYVYRFVTTGTMEKKVYDLQILKEGVSKRVVDERTTERKFKLADRQKYFDLDEFEESLRQQQKKIKSTASEAGVEDSDDGIISRPNPETDGVLQRVLAKFNALNLGSDSAAVTSSPDTDTASNAAAPDSGGWILDWFEQETMFEEDLDQQCTPLEQKEIMESHLYLKSMRRLRKNGSHMISRDGVLFAKCPTCSHSNEVFPEATTGVPVPTKLDCSYCRNSVPTVGATNVPPAPHIPYASYGHRGFPGAMPPMGGVGIRVVGAVPMVVDSGNGAPGTLPGGHVLPPHLMAIYQEQQKKQQQQQQDRLAQQQRHAEIRERERQIAIENQRRKREEELRRRQTYELKDRCLLVLRRGMTGCQELKRSAEACGAKIAIEVNAQTTDIVSAMSKEETLKFLKLYKLPSDVELRDEAWLRSEIAKARGEGTSASSSVSGAGAGASSAPGEVNSSSTATGSPSRSSEAPAPSSHPAPDMSSETIDLFDSDNEGDDDAARPAALAAAPVPPTTNEGESATAEAEEDDDDDDVIEIL